MKKLLILLAILLIAAPALADWSVTVTWTPSVGPDLASETVLYGGAEKCNVAAGSPASCNFVVPALGAAVVVRSANGQGAYAETASVIITAQPAPASGVNVHVTYVAP